MSVSLYYRFQRDQPLTDGERVEMAATLAESGELGGTPLHPDDPPIDGCLLSGTGQPPKDDMLVVVLDEWLDSLSYLAGELNGHWEVRLDDLFILWDEVKVQFNISKTFRP